MSERRSFQLYKLAKEFVEEAKKLFGRSEKATERVDPAVEGAANATQNVKPKVTPAEAQKARDDRIASEAEALAKANGITSISDKLGSLDPRRIGRDGAPEFDKRLKELSETATQNGLVNATVRADGKGLLSAKKAEEALLRGEPIHPREMRLIQDAKTNEYDIWAKKDAVINRPNAGGAGLGGLTGLGGLSGLQKYGIIGTVAAGAMGWLGVAITGDDPNDPADNNLTHIQRIPYKIGKVTSDEGKEQIKLALAATLENSKKNLAEANLQKASAERERQEKELNQSAMRTLAGAGAGTLQTSDAKLAGLFKYTVGKHVVDEPIEATKLDAFAANFVSIARPIDKDRDGKLSDAEQDKLVDSPEFKSLIRSIPASSKPEVSTAIQNAIAKELLGLNNGP